MDLHTPTSRTTCSCPHIPRRPFNGLGTFSTFYWFLLSTSQFAETGHFPVRKPSLHFPCKAGLSFLKIQRTIWTIAEVVFMICASWALSIRIVVSNIFTTVLTFDNDSRRFFRGFYADVLRLATVWSSIGTLDINFTN